MMLACCGAEARFANIGRQKLFLSLLLFFLAARRCVRPAEFSC